MKSFATTGALRTPPHVNKDTNPAPEGYPLFDTDADERIEDMQGVSADYLFRGRLQFLAAQTTTLHQQIQFSDAKGAMLMTALGFIAARGGFNPGFGS